MKRIVFVFLIFIIFITYVESNEYETYKKSTVKNIELGDKAYSLGQYIIAYSYYKTALENGEPFKNSLDIQYKLGLTQRALQHPKGAYNCFSVLWKAGRRNTEFLKSYYDVLFTVGMYNTARVVLDTLCKRSNDTTLNILYTELDFALSSENDSSTQLSAKDITHDTTLNTAFSEYGMSMIDDQLIFSSTRPLSLTEKMDPRTGHAYSKLYTTRYNKTNKTWGEVSLLRGEVENLIGNIGTFSYDKVRNIAYFMWSQKGKSGIYTMTREADGSWSNLQEFAFNYQEGKSTLAGLTGHPCISSDGNRLLFVVKDLDLNSVTDIWFLERSAASKTVAPKKRRRVVPPSKSTTKARAKTRARVVKKKVGEKVYIIVNKDWQIPIRYSNLINTREQESFPQWIDKYTFAFSSDGHIGIGGMDLYLAKLDSNYKDVKDVIHLPRPFNTSFDDHSLMVNKDLNITLFSSNRYTGRGHTDNIYSFSKTGMDFKIVGSAYDSISGEGLFWGSVFLKNEYTGLIDTLSIDTVGVFTSGVLKSGKYKLTSNIGEYSQKIILLDYDSLVSGLPLIEERKIEILLLPFVEEVGVDIGISLADVPSVEIDSLTEEPLESTIIEMFTEELYEADSVMEAHTIYVDTMEEESLNTIISFNVEPEIPVTLVSSLDEASLTTAYVPFALPVGDYGKQDLTEYMSDDLSPAEMIAALNKNKIMHPTVDERYIDDYSKRINDPLRRISKLAVLPEGVDCEFCDDETKQVESGKPFYVASKDDKALIVLSDAAGNTSYIDLAPNAAYSIDIRYMNMGGMPSLPTNIDISDIKKTVITRDYILFECIPKLSELGDEVYINNLYFEFDDEELSEDAYRELDRMIIIAIKNPNMVFGIGAHADERGDAEYNERLTDMRIESTINYVEKKGLDLDRLKTTSYGATFPLIVGAETEKQHRLNRRISVKLIKQDAENILQDDITYPVQEHIYENTDHIVFKIQLGAYRQPLEIPLEYYKNVFEVEEISEITYYMDIDGLYKYCAGESYFDIEEVRAIVKELLAVGRECYVAVFYKGERITVTEAEVIIEHNNNNKQK